MVKWAFSREKLGTELQWGVVLGSNPAPDGTNLRGGSPDRRGWKYASHATDRAREPPETRSRPCSSPRAWAGSCRDELYCCARIRAVESPELESVRGGLPAGGRYRQCRRRRLRSGQGAPPGGSSCR